MRRPLMLRSALLILGIAVAGLAASDVFAQRASRVPLKLHESEVSFVGDDSFISGRFTWDPLPRNHIWKETLTFSGGFMNFYKLNPGYSYSDERTNDSPKSILKSWKRAKGTRKRGLELRLSDVKIARNQYGNYHYAVKGNVNGACAAAKQFFGDTSNSGWISSGTKATQVGACWNPSRGSAKELEVFLHKIMTESRFDEGKINDAKAAGGYKAPAAGAKQPRPAVASISKAPGGHPIQDAHKPKGFDGEWVGVLNGGARECGFETHPIKAEINGNKITITTRDIDSNVILEGKINASGEVEFSGPRDAWQVAAITSQRGRVADVKGQINGNSFDGTITTADRGAGHSRSGIVNCYASFSMVRKSAMQLNPATAPVGSAEVRLRKLKELEKKGLIDSGEAKSKREQILAKLTGARSTNSAPTVPVKLNWEGVGGSLQGILEADFSSNSGKEKLRFGRNGTRCNGFWSHSDGTYGRTGKVHGTWTVSCPDGVSAGGTYSRLRTH